MASLSIRSVCLSTLALLFWASAAWAASAATEAPVANLTPPIPGELSWWSYVQALGVLFLVLGVLWAALWLLRRSGRFAGMPRPGSLPRDGLYLEGHLNLGPRKGLMVVRFLNKRLLLGITEHQITLLTETDPNDVPPSPAATTFQRCLDNADDPAVSGSCEPDKRSGAG